MAKELESATKEFELTEAFWKKYKPDSVKETGLSGKLRDYQKQLAKAEEIEASGAGDDARYEAWVKVEEALDALTQAMLPPLTALAKDKASHTNLKKSLERAHKELKDKSHPAYQHAGEKKIASRPPVPLSETANEAMEAPEKLIGEVWTLESQVRMEFKRVKETVQACINVPNRNPNISRASAENILSEMQSWLRDARLAYDKLQKRERTEEAP